MLLKFAYLSFRQISYKINAILILIEWDITQKTFDVEDSEKSIKMALYAPNLLRYDEMLIWKVIENHEYFWRSLRFPLFFVFQQANSFMLSAYVSVE